MSTKKVVTSMIGLVLLYVPYMSFAQCNAKIDKVEHIFDNFEQYYSLQTTDAKKQLRISVVDDEKCQLHIILKSENQGKLKGVFQTIAYRYSSNAQQLLSSSISRLEFIDSKAEIELLIPSGTPVKAGIYKDRLQVELYDQNNNFLDELQLDIDTNIAPRTNLSVLGYNTLSSTISLGELTPRQTYSMLPSLQIVTNSDVKLRISSDNKGKLVHSIYKHRYDIDYYLDMAGNELHLSQDIEQAYSYNGQTVFLLPLRIHLADFREQAAGEYSDTIRFQISPLNY
ncbi:hypothetical protein WNY98_12275 [Pseudoalteromonas sp. AS71]|uniref:hypothetical protein n=1 Tax=Pseudoalteromonas sp. AS71 TaxID=3135777 RepID=UPI00316CC3E3